MNRAYDFSFDRLVRMYRLAARKGYSPAFFGEEEHTKARIIIWRHDIDLDIGSALDFARFEAGEGIRSTYFFMVRSRFYNLFAKDSIKAINEICKLGHEVALHCDLEIPRDAQLPDEVVEERVARDFDLLETVFGPGVFLRKVSFHNPPKAVLGKSYSSFYSTYQEHFFGQVKYLSDSNRQWQGYTPEHWLESEEVHVFVILLHPIIWTTAGHTMPEAVRDFLEKRRRELLVKLEEDEIVVS